jgi:hypothetical protein
MLNRQARAKAAARSDNERSKMADARSTLGLLAAKFLRANRGTSHAQSAPEHPPRVRRRLTVSMFAALVLIVQACGADLPTPPEAATRDDAGASTNVGADARSDAANDAPGIERGDATREAGVSEGGFRAGFAREEISPALTDTWIDSNGNGAYEPGNGETFVDGNGNKQFDAYWLAGFSLSRPANSVHDPMVAVAAVFDDGKKRIGFVVIDSIGFMYDDVEDVRKRVDPSLRIDHLVVVSTHDHEVPDLQGLWGPSDTETGVNAAYLEFVKSKMVSAVGAATRAMRPAELRAIERPLSPNGLMVDSRQPVVYDSDLRILEVRERGTGKALGQIVNWANHPETLWGKNVEISADFPGYVRDGIDRGIVYPAGVKRSAHGGITLYVNGAIGGLMTPIESLPIRDRFLNQTFTAPSHDKARALGYAVADEVLSALASSSLAFDSAPALALWVKKLDLPVGNLKLLAATEGLGIVKRTVDYDVLTPIIHTEVDLLRIGNTSILTIPGEAYPELVNGGVESPAGADFGGAPVEVPAWRSLMPGAGAATMKMVFGLANDSIGYIVPHSQWDENAPFSYSRDSAPYGEGNSVGPETAPLLHQAVREVCKQAGGSVP